MEKVTLKVKNGPDIAFNGEEVAYEHILEEDTALRVYDTEKGHWLMTLTSNDDVLIKHEIIENKSVESLVKSLGYTAYAKSIYKQLGIDTTNNLDI
ncbi:hypothetical protein [Klebsiella quasipneumoniae]|uniref:hypothetical protein n=1 Tax=Klebsiella quasipneumoniae TaxID=1463165 RepID=UPI0022CDC274|nr:hypothetical protein [Klebsiella quasipneumoniae]MCZ9525341.1 hypothetical protein [Klebsiella quasipneumoniae]